MKKLIFITTIFSNSLFANCEISKNWYATYTNKYPCPQFTIWNVGKPISGHAFCGRKSPITTGTGLYSNDKNAYIFGGKSWSFKNEGTHNTIYATSTSHQEKYKTETRYSICIK